MFSPREQSKPQADGAAEKSSQRRHFATGVGEGPHKPRTTNLFVGEFHTRTEIAKLEILHKFVIARKASGWTGELAGIVPVKKFADSPPFLGT